MIPTQKTLVAEPLAGATTTREAEVLKRFPLRRQRTFWQQFAATRPWLWICFLLACLGTSWFASQCLLVPHPASFAPDWQGARWIQGADGASPIAYFRYKTDLNALPDGAFVTVAGGQIFTMYVNEIYIGSNKLDFIQGNFPRAYMFDVLSSLHLGENVIAVRVTNVDGKVPTLRLNFGMAHGNTIFFHGTDAKGGWLATTDSDQAHPRFSETLRDWTKRKFNATSWPPVVEATQPAAEPLLNVNPLIYEQPMPRQWMSTGTGHEAYFVRQLSLPLSTNGTWLRLVATGSASIFINGYLFMVWNGQAVVPQKSIVDYLSSESEVVEYRAGLVSGVYDISSYLHPGVNTIAIHISSPGIVSTRAGLGNLNAAIAMDILSTDLIQHASWQTAAADWHAATQPVMNWAQGSAVAMTWPQPYAIGRPGVTQSFYLSDSSNPRNQQYIPPSLILIVIASSVVAVLLCWLVMTSLIRRYRSTFKEGLETSVLAFLPALACEGLLIALSREPQMPRPFPYTWWWSLGLILVLLVSYMMLWYNARLGATLHVVRAVGASSHHRPHLYTNGLRVLGLSTPGGKVVLGWLRLHWGLVLIMLLAVPMITYNLPYEPYWQDELTSYYAAKGVLAHGLPLMPSGFLYAKAELYSYVLALWMAIFGDQAGVPRTVSIVEYLVSLPVLYCVGCHFFGRRVALLATAMLAFSPTSLIWGRQVRMYEQAQLFMILTMYFFHRALYERERVWLVYVAAITLVLDYLSHEETFIILPAIAFCILWIKGKEYWQWYVANKAARRRIASTKDVLENSFAQSAHKEWLTKQKKAAAKSNFQPTWRMYAHWGLAMLLAITCIGLQLLISRNSHPFVLGTDQSQRPMIQFTTDNMYYYIYLLFYPAMLGPSQMPLIVLNSLLATAGCIVALRGNNSRAKYCVVFLVFSLLTLTFAFTMATDRYLYPILPVYYLLASYALWLALSSLGRFARVRLALPQAVRGSVAMPEGFLTRPTRIAAMITVFLLCACVLITPILPLSSYNLFVSQEVGFSYHKHYPDYNAAGQYVQQHWRKGDIIIAVSPAISVLYYVGHVDYFFSIDRALYLFEHDGHIIDTPTGSIALLNQNDFLAVVASHPRVWLVSDGGLYQLGAATKDNRFVFPAEFHMVFEGYGSTIYFQGS